MKDKKVLKEIALIFGFFVIISGNVLTQELSNLDEIWIYNFGRCIFNGLVPYRDFNIIITPLFPYICAFFLKIFGNEMIVLRFAEIIEISFILFLIYKILDRLKINKSVACICSLGLYFLFVKAFCFDYNWTVLLITLIVIYVELHNAKNTLDYNFKRDLLLGLLVRMYNFIKTNHRNCTFNSIYIL